MLSIYLLYICRSYVRKKEHLNFYADTIEAPQFCAKAPSRKEKGHNDCIFFITWEGNDWLVKMYFESVVPQLFPKRLELAKGDQFTTNCI